jgi:oligoribonuclease NrnB/cAMP/cGMP phosphodiesterase (DHH superfamily)
MFIWAGGEPSNVIFRAPNDCVLQLGDLPLGTEEVWYADCCPHDLTDPCGGLPFRVFDHHVSNARKFDGDSRCTFDMDRSGTSLMAHVLGIDEWDDFGAQYRTTSELISAFEDYDLGRFESKPGMRLADIAASYSQADLLGMFVSMDPDDILGDRRLSSRAEAMAASREIYSTRAAASALITDFPMGERVLKVGVAVSPVDWKNETALKILERGVDLVLIIDAVSGMASLRSRDSGPDCSMIAGLYGGGGHARAAGFKLSTHQLLRNLFEGVFE